MIVRSFFFLLGFGLSVIGFTYIISYLNLLTIGYTFIEYISFISKRIECLTAIIGLIMIICTIFKGGEKSDICL